ncbi:putative leucine-rich repeat receptor-like serine/threonine-protein kinase At2g24130 isoform X1 [Phoenix dactylifera]|uniref:non-specific serine/threonine protein kinase n=1 Tax=Phoenix dactylifera TaxID=42345 RepID=A0A8B7C283_PHODC|nr:putative leucine-rich repeat receptor-like serine/threonine-protein kinase At2g24130 isoform X1 [Phoenix dactylifera]
MQIFFFASSWIDFFTIFPIFGHPYPQGKSQEALLHRRLKKNPQNYSNRNLSKMSSTTIITQFLFLLLPSVVQPFYLRNDITLDRSALLAFKKAILVDPDKALSSWNETTHVCEWHGIVCRLNPERVTELDLKSKYLLGTISPFLSNLSYLRLLDLSENSLQGSIPIELGALSNLELLGIQGNHIQNEIPESFGMLRKLRYINLGNNQLSGRLPTSLFYNCTQLSYVDLSNNWFTGLIPLQLGDQLPSLENLLLYQNQLTGSVPASLSNSTEMVEIDLENNYLSGTLPSEILMHLPSLKILHLSYNNFSSDDQNSNLVPFFISIANLTHLEELELAGNYLGGTLPSTIGLLSVNLSQVYLQDNLIHGAIPSSISNLSKLMSLNLSNNLLNGTIPLELILLPNLQRLWLANNLLYGRIPSPPGVLNNLGLLDLSKNNLSGSIPTTLANLTQLRILILNGNFLSGSIPSSLGSTKLELLDLSHNRLTGAIPAEVASLSSMAIYFNLSDNLLGGELPMELSKMDKVWAIDLSSNNFSSNIPSTMGSCKVVEMVNLSHNHLQGPIPGSLGNLLNLQSLDLSSNFLSGEIPASLQKCTSLRLLDLSFNNFSGPLPENSLCNYLTPKMIEGNHFCGSQPGLPSCQPKKRSMIHSPKSLVLFVSIVSMSTFLLTIICVIGYKNIRNAMFRRDDVDSSDFSLDLSSSYPRITYREIVEATGGFEQGRLIGSGSFGQVYRGVLSDGSVVAIKVLQLQSSNSARSFNRECQVLKRIRHRNLMRIITACSLPDFKALVLPFMANGSLESHLYPQAQQSASSKLSLIKRVNICSDIAEGLAYLHHHSPVQIIHCDLKPSNILLNDDMTALVSDFGIARLVMKVAEGNILCDTPTNSTANQLCGSIGYVAPEYGYGRGASTKGDVYSFGILVLEIVTRKRPTDDMFIEGLSLQMWVKNHYHDQLENVIDYFLMQDLQDKSPEVRNMWEVAIVELLELGLICTQEAPSTRPTMLDAADDLDRLKHYLGCDKTATFTSSRGISSSTITGDYW